MKNILLSIFIISNVVGQPDRQLSRTTSVSDEFDKYTSVGQLGLTITNFGILGNGWNRMEDGSINPSCVYKQNTEVLREQIEHFSYAGLWIGGLVNGQRRVSTAIVDGVFDSGEEGFEFFSKSSIDIKSSIASTTQDSMAQYYSPDAVSHQDMVATFSDYGDSPSDGQNIINHNPLGIDVELKAYAWNYSYADAFTILNYTITNMSEDTIKNIYSGIWADASIANFNYTNKYEPGGGFTWTDNLDGYDQSNDASGFSRDIGYQYDADGDDGWAESYFGISVLGGNVPQPYLKSHYQQWAWTNSNNADYPSFGMPLDDFERYTKLKSNVQTGPGAPDYTEDGYPTSPDSWLFLLSAGPLGSIPSNADSSSWTLPPGENCNVSFTVVCGLWGNGSGDSPERRENLIVNYDWAQKAFDGEDKNRNNILDENEDTNNNNVIDRYILPAPPPSPNMKLMVESQKVTIYWQNNAEYFKDPISQEKDFEGYRIYGARKTQNELLGEFTLLGEFDSVNNIGYNTDFDLIRITDDYGSPDSILIDGNYYHYKFVNDGVNNGWINYYAVTAYDQGDPDANLESLESSIYSNRTYVYPGQQASQRGNWSSTPTVYPNPYKGQAHWDGSGSRNKMIWFQNLPQTAEIRIFTLAGDLVDIIEHDESYKGLDVQNIDSQKSPQMSGGEHAWDLITMHDQAAATGLYLFSVEDKSSGQVKEGKFLIIK